MLLIPALLLVACERGAPVEEPTTPDAPPAAPDIETSSDGDPVASEVPSRDWPTSRGDAALTGHSPWPLPESFDLRWTFEAGGPIASSPVVVGGDVYFGSDDGQVRCVRDGDLVWSFPTDYLIEAPPFVHDGVVYIGSNDFVMYAIDATTGAERWRYETDEKIVGGATIVETPERDILIFGSHDFFVYGLDASTGEVVWTYETMERVNATPARVGHMVYVGGCGTRLHEIDGRTGEGRTALELGGECHIIASVAIADGHAYLGHYDMAFVAIDLSTDEIAWEYVSPRFGFGGPPALSPDLVVFGGRDSRLHAVDRATGAPKWTYVTRRKVDA
ncbi:MAG: PQQ-binding-like beta-propeller repeat protein, partial [Phycisphaerales bacterium]|nr:PQQ-binding-like beta-propeller repeat protein [Phycisphaerales bacterium]